jgi:Gram-negative porin
MKKLITITALLAASVGYAQTITGTVNYDVTRSNGASTMGIADSTIVISGTEKIGSLNVTAKLGLDGAARDKSISGRDAQIEFSDSVMGSLTLGSVEVGNGLASNTFKLVPGIGSDGVVVAGPANRNIVKYETAKFSGFEFSVTDTQPTVGGSHSQTYGMTFGAGKLSTSVDYTAQTDRVRLSGQYDFGVAKVGAGLSARETGVANSYIVAVAVPVTPSVTLGGAYYNGNGKSYEVAGSYALSKRTSVALAYRTVSENSDLTKNVGTTRARVQYQF